MNVRYTLQEVSPEDAKTYLPRLNEHMYKYSRGRAIVAAGSDTYPGAAILAARAAHVAGAGYVTAYIPNQAQVALLSSAPSVVIAHQKSFIDTVLEASSERPCVLLVGSGFSQGDAQTYLLDHACSQQVPLVIDGSALHILAARKDIAHEVRDREFPTIITPHYAEAIALLRATPTFFLTYKLDSNEHTLSLIEEISSNNLWPNVAQYLSNRFQVACVLKGPDTYISVPALNHDSSSKIACVTNGTAALAKAGSGDVLAGIITAFLSFSYSLSYNDVQNITSSAVWCHAQSAVITTSKMHELSVTPESLLDFLYLVYNELK